MRKPLFFLESSQIYRFYLLLRKKFTIFVSEAKFSFPRGWASLPVNLLPLL